LIAVSSDTSTPNIGGFAWVQVSVNMIAAMCGDGDRYAAAAAASAAASDDVDDVLN
jgi:hypothetical protein